MLQLTTLPPRSAKRPPSSAEGSIIGEGIVIGDQKYHDRWNELELSDNSENSKVPQTLSAAAEKFDCGIARESNLKIVTEEAR